MRRPQRQNGGEVPHATVEMFLQLTFGKWLTCTGYCRRFFTAPERWAPGVEVLTPENAKRGIPRS
jgi:hypothetical protein